MRDPLGLNERLFARYYPRLVARAEDAGQRETRHELIGKARGRVLELGAGSGLNLPHYGRRVSELILSEPSPHMLSHLHRALAEHPPAVDHVRLVEAPAERLAFEDASFDTIVATYILCTTPDPGLVLREVHRLLRPGGLFLFLEHVRAPEGSGLARVQDLVELPHRYLAAGCHPNRRTAELLERSPLDVVRLEHGRQPAALPTVRPTICGWARRPDPVQAATGA